MALKVLHISNGFLGLTQVHKKLYSKLDELGVGQIIFAPVRNGKSPRSEREISFSMPESQILFSRFLKKYHRYMFRSKIRFLFNDLKRQYDLKSLSAVHATTLYSDGAIALRIFKEYKKEYIVTVRNTDINIFLKYRPDLIFLAREILDNAGQIIFTNEAFKEKLFRHPVLRKNRAKYLEKAIMVNNGIDDFWLENIRPHERIDVNPAKIIYVGRLSHNKNLPRLIEAVLSLKRSGKNVRLEIVGDGASRMQVETLASANPDTIVYRGPIYDLHELKEIYRSAHLFAMPSMVETFGLVYIEALTQGLPVLYSQNQGIDGVFTEKVGERVNPTDTESIASGLRKIIEEYELYEVNAVDFRRFNWNLIAGRYIEIYKFLEKQS